MKLLVLGGTIFLGRHVVDAALARAHKVTLFNRGRENAHLFPELEKLRGDRDGDVAALRGRRFDAIVDLSGYTPAHVRATADALDGGHYVFVSTISVHRALAPGRSFDETAPLAEGNDGYGPLKARAEEVLTTMRPEATIVRPGLIVGPWDPTDRFTYWPRRVARGGDVLAPGRPERPVQIIDARDLADWCVRLAERPHSGVFTAVGPAETLTMGRLLDECREVTGSDARFTWIPDAELVAAGATQWTEVPLWITEDHPRVGGMLLGDNRRAVAAGLTFRPLADTIRDTLAWDRAHGPEPSERTAPVTPLSAEREAELLAAHV